MNRLRQKIKRLMVALLSSLIAVAPMPVSLKYSATAADSTDNHASDVGVFSEHNYNKDSLRGDVNKDGVIDATDASDALHMYAENSIGGYAYDVAADMDKDGSVDASDASTILIIYSQLSISKAPEEFSRMEILYSDRCQIYSSMDEDSVSMACLNKYETYYVIKDLDEWLLVTASNGEKDGYIRKETNFDSDILIDNGPSTFYTMERYVGTSNYPLKEVCNGIVIGDSEDSLQYGDIFYRLLVDQGQSLIYIKGKGKKYALIEHTFKSEVILPQGSVTDIPTTAITVPQTTQTSAETETTTTTTISTTSTETETTTTTTISTTSTETETTTTGIFETKYLVYTADGEPWNIRKEADQNSDSVGKIYQGEVFEVRWPVTTASGWYQCKKYTDEGTTAYGYIYLYDYALQNYFQWISKEEYDRVILYGGT